LCLFKGCDDRWIGRVWSKERRSIVIRVVEIEGCDWWSCVWCGLSLVKLVNCQVQCIFWCSTKCFNLLYNTIITSFEVFAKPFLLKKYIDQ
jgi:hypothetical protein